MEKKMIYQVKEAIEAHKALETELKQAVKEQMELFHKPSSFISHSSTIEQFNTVAKQTMYQIARDLPVDKVQIKQLVASMDRIDTEVSNYTSKREAVNTKVTELRIKYSEALAKMIKLKEDYIKARLKEIE